MITCRVVTHLFRLARELASLSVYSLSLSLLALLERIKKEKIEDEQETNE
jgi:hypothetical protein